MKLAYSLLLGMFFIGSACHDDEEPEDQTKQKTKVSNVGKIRSITSNYTKILIRVTV